MNKLNALPLKISFSHAYAILIASCLITSCGKPNQDATDYNKVYASQDGGTLIDATIGEPSGLIYMVAGESAAAAISGNIFNKLLKYDKNLDLEGDGFLVG